MFTKYSCFFLYESLNVNNKIDGVQMCKRGPPEGTVEVGQHQARPVAKLQECEKSTSLPLQYYIEVVEERNIHNSMIEVSQERPPGGGDTRTVIKYQGWNPPN